MLSTVIPIMLAVVVLGAVTFLLGPLVRRGCLLNKGIVPGLDADASFWRWTITGWVCVVKGCNWVWGKTSGQGYIFNVRKCTRCGCNDLFSLSYDQ